MRRRFRQRLEFLDAADIVQKIDWRQPDAEQHEKRLAGGQRADGFVVLPQGGDRLRDALGTDVVEGRGLHDAVPPLRARSTASETRRGVSGVSLNFAPIAPKASKSGVARAAGGARAPPSPTPLTPYSVHSAGVTECAIRTVGTSGAQGTM